MADIGGAFVNAFATGANIKQSRRAQEESKQTNALNRKVTNENLLRANRTEARGVMDALRGQAAKGAAWAAQDPANRLDAFKTHMMRAYDMAEAQGTDPALIGRAREALQTLTPDQLGPIAAQAMDFGKQTPTSALEEARQAVQAGTATPDQRRMAGVLVKEGTGSQDKPLSPTQKQAQLKLKAMEDYLNGTATPQQERLIGADADPLVREAIQAVMSRAGAQAMTADEFVSEVENRTQQIRASRHGEGYTEWERDASGKLVPKK